MGAQNRIRGSIRSIVPLSITVLIAVGVTVTIMTYAMNRAIDNEKTKYAEEMEKEKTKFAKTLESEKKRFTEAYRKAVAEYEQKDLVLDDAFVNKYFTDDYNALNAIRQKIDDYDQDISAYTVDISDQKDGDGLSEGILCLKAYVSGTNSSTLILYISDAIALLTKSKEQYDDMEKFDGMLRVAMANLSKYSNDLDSLVLSAKCTSHQLTYSHVSDSIKEAKGIMERLKKEMNEKYESVKNKRKEAERSSQARPVKK